MSQLTPATFNGAQSDVVETSANAPLAANSAPMIEKLRVLARFSPSSSTVDIAVGLSIAECMALVERVMVSFARIAAPLNGQ